jgi:hypothetical protein
VIFRTLNQRSEGYARRVVQYGGRGEFAAFTYVAAPDPEAESLSVVFRDGAPLVAEYVPPIRSGVEQGRVALAECGEWFGSVKVEITSMRHHEVESSPAAFARLAKQIVQGELRERCDALRSLDPSWRTPDVLALARQLHREREYEALPMLADALEEAGCDFGLLLEHCRSGCDHGESCWAVQLTLAETG